jgi:hypothetical protein
LDVAERSLTIELARRARLLFAGEKDGKDGKDGKETTNEKAHVSRLEAVIENHLIVTYPTFVFCRTADLPVPPVLPVLPVLSVIPRIQRQLE